MTIPSTPEIISHYRLLEPIGQGGMGQVWLAQDTLLPRRVVVKLLHAGLGSDPGAVERLLREARAAASVDHPNVVTVHEAGIHDGQPFLVMQHVEGETLEARLARGPLPVADAVAVARGIADALAEVHALGIVHRDLKPANVILTTRGPRILDFGISAMRDSPQLTTTGVVLGTPLTMSPEQFAGGAPDRRSDLWSLGVMLYQALTGIRPFDGDRFEVVAHRVMNHSPDAPSRHNREVPAALDRVVAHLLTRDPDRRYARAEDVVADLAAALAEPGGGPVNAAGDEPRLAVLYFDVLSPEPDDQFLAAGLTEDLIVDLARVRGLQVSARGEVLPFRERGMPPRTVARELGVGFVLQGSVRRAGNRGRITAQLVRAADGHAVWAERFDRTLEDLFDVQAEVSKRIVEALEITLRPAERAMLDRAPTRNREAYAYFLRGTAHDDVRRRASSRRAEECFRQALALDPEFALAHAALARCLAQRAMSWWTDPTEIADAESHARRALALDPDLPEAHMALGMTFRAGGRHAEALDQVRAAQMIDSTGPDIMLWVGKAYLEIGRAEEAVRVLERAFTLHPRDYRILSAYTDCSDVLGRTEVVARMLVRIREVIIASLDRTPDDSYGRAVLGIALAQAGDVAAGIAQTERALADDHEDGRVYYCAACAFAYAGLPERAIEQLRIMLREYPGYPRQWALHDVDLAPLRELPAFIEMFGRASS